MLSVVKTSRPLRPKAWIFRFWMRSAICDCFVLFGEVFDKDGELVAAESRYGVALAQVVLETVGDTNQ